MTTLAAPKTPDQMSVSELRGWLSSFSKKQKEHYDQNQVVPRRRSPIKMGGRLSVRQRILGLEQPRDDVSVNSQQENFKPGSTFSSSSSFTTARRSFKPFGPENRQEENESPPRSSNKRGTTTVPYQPSMFEQLHRIESGKIYTGTSSATTWSQGDESVVESVGDVPEDTKFLETTADDSKGTTEDKSFPPDLSLAFSGLSAVSSASSSVAVEASDSIVGNDAFELFEDTKEFKVNPFRLQSTKQKELPETFSDFEPTDFDASLSEDSDDSEAKEKAKDKALASNHWPAWNGDARQFLKQQSLPALQGCWSDQEEDVFGDDDDDGDTVATGLRTEPSGFRYGNGRITRKKNRRREPHFREPGQLSFTLFDAAKASATGTRRRTKSLSDHFNSGSSKTARKPRETHSPTNESFHSANLFQDKTMTADALDVICKERPEKATTSYQRKSSLGSFLENGGRHSASSISSYQRKSSLGNLLEHRGRGSASSASMSADSGRPSVAPDAVDANLSRHFNMCSEKKTTGAFVEQRQTDNIRSSSSNEQREEAPLDQLREDKSKEYDSKSENSSSNHSWAALPITTTASSDQSTATSGASPANSLTSVIEKFGGGGARQTRKSRIQRQKEALEQQWAADRKPKHVKKTKWAVSSGGLYKKKVVLDFEYK